MQSNVTASQLTNLLAFWLRERTAFQLILATYLHCKFTVNKKIGHRSVIVTDCNRTAQNDLKLVFSDTNCIWRQFVLLHG